MKGKFHISKCDMHWNMVTRTVKPHMQYSLCVCFLHSLQLR